MTTAFDEVIAVRDLGTPDADEVTITGADPVVSTRFKIGETAAAVLGGIGVAVNDIWELKTGERQTATVDVHHAAAALRSGGGTELICDPVMRRNILSRLKRKRRREPLGSRCTTLLRPSAKE